MTGFRATKLSVLILLAIALLSSCTPDHGGNTPKPSTPPATTIGGLVKFQNPDNKTSVSLQIPEEWDVRSMLGTSVLRYMLVVVPNGSPRDAIRVGEYFTEVPFLGITPITRTQSGPETMRDKVLESSLEESRRFPEFYTSLTRLNDTIIDGTTFYGYEMEAILRQGEIEQAYSWEYWYGDVQTTFYKIELRGAPGRDIPEELRDILSSLEFHES